MIEIRRMAAEDTRYLHTIENRHLASESVVVRLNRTGFQLEYRPMNAAVWHTYAQDLSVGYTANDFLVRDDRDVYFAWLEEQLVGQIALIQNWNHLALIWDIRVAVAARRRGVGEAMMELAEEWAWKKGLVGVMLETQDTNPGACQFYTHCGYKLGGVDCMLYAGLPQAMQGKQEGALFFYKFFK